MVKCNYYSISTGEMMNGTIEIEKLKTVEQDSGNNTDILIYITEVL